MSDAGEPHGTAGRPMLHALLHSRVGEVVVVCPRFYGGVKLGTGGLARAYAGGVKHVQEACPTVEKVERRAVVATVAYKAVRSVDRVLEDLGATVNERTFGTGVRYRILFPCHRLEDLAPAIAEVTGGRGRVAADNTTA